jgi:CheY-like chemotaxis protein
MVETPRDELGPRPEAVLTDIRMPAAGVAGPAMDGINVAHTIRAEDPASAW